MEVSQELRRIEYGEIGSIKHSILCAWEFQFSDLTLEI